LSKAAAYAEWRARPLGMIPDFDDINVAAAKESCRTALEQRGSGWLSADETRRVLSAMALPLPGGGVARTADEAVELARQIGFPVAIKLASHKLVHKTEIGGIHLDVRD